MKAAVQPARKSSAATLARRAVRAVEDALQPYKVQPNGVAANGQVLNPPSGGPQKSSAVAAQPKATPTAAVVSVVSQVRGTRPSLALAAPWPLPAVLKPQLAVLADEAPEDETQWIYEIKYDGYRLLTRVDNDGAVRMFNRTGKDWSDKLKALQRELQRMQLPSGWYDGEIVVHNARTGRPDFAALQNSMGNADSADIVLHLFDLPYFDGKDLRQQPLHVRRAVLEKCLQKAPASLQVGFSKALDADTGSLMASVAKLGLEGIMGKRRDSPYVSQRSGDWIKLKCQQRQEFVIGGYSDPQGSRQDVGALLLGVFDSAGSLHYAGRVGAGLDAKTLRELAARLKPLAIHKCPFVDSAGIEGAVHWLRPDLVAEVDFQGWTQAGRICQAVFRGLRTDKAPRTVVRETAMATTTTTTATPTRAAANTTTTTASMAAMPRITHAERVIDDASGLTKGDLVDYYRQAADLLLVDLQDRPAAVLRAPAGLQGDKFFQKHPGVGAGPGIDAMPVEGAASSYAMLQIRGAQGVLAAAQWNVVEFHTSNASRRALLLPDRMVFDLDPGEGVQWVQMQEAAALVRAFLAQLGLPSFLKTSGGKGLHVVVPLRRLHDWATVKDVSQAIVRHISTQVPQRLVAKSGGHNRVGKIFIDYLRNGEGATTVSAWSARARSGMGISVPVAWDELDQLRGGDHWTVRTVAERLPVGNAPWNGYAKAARSLTFAMQKLGYKPAGQAGPEVERIA